MRADTTGGLTAINHTSGAVVHQRLAPAGLKGLLGSHGARRAPLLAAAVLLFVAACVVLVFVPSPPVTAGLIFVVPVAIIASELGTRAGLATALLSLVVVLGWLYLVVRADTPNAEVPRSIALLFLAWIIGRTSDRAARSRELIEQMLGATTDAVYVKDLQGRYLAVNDAAAALIGLTASEILGRRDRELLPEIAALTAPYDAAVLAHRQSVTYEVSGRLGGSTREVSITQSPFCDTSGTVIGSLVIARDVTDQRRLQERFRRAFEDAPIGMAVVDLQGRFLEVNEALCAIVGRTADHLCGCHFTALTHEADVEADYRVMADLLAGAMTSSTDEKRYRRPDGSPVWVARTVTLVRAADGTALHFLDQVQDITDRRRFEAELRRLADHDPLTGLLNRRRFALELERHVGEVARYGRRGAVLVLDVDRFKRVNDTLGHHAGDELICDVALALRARLRESDVVARLGGDEFAVLLPQGDGEEALVVASEIVATVRERISADGPVTVSVGVAAFVDEPISGDDMLIAADLAMYRAKADGGDGCAVSLPERREGRCAQTS